MYLCCISKSTLVDASEGVGAKQDRVSQNRDSQGRDSQGRDSQGRDSQGRDSQGRDSQGRDSQGRDSQGKDSQGSGMQDKDQIEIMEDLSAPVTVELEDILMARKNLKSRFVNV